ncbi:hypothetical protein HPB50_010223 [Hyalomma asiaticum]|uniref:Uncharacterized protein n=1 Tax=Hyalomma asiaticum TaxID=266040 RepID=A0ACB7RQA6_HYAAI|nr:hypothetical protein HPB50_010223 [Hyalomma asiaticum]
MVGAFTVGTMLGTMSSTVFDARVLDHSLRIAVVFAFAVTLPSISHGQKIQFKPCADHPEAKDVEITSAFAKDLEVGKTVTVDVTVVARKQFNSDPKLNLAITTSNNVKLPCMFNVGSCTYKMCNAYYQMEKFLASVWDNKCPIEPKEYKKSISYFIPALARVAIGDGRLHFRGEMTNGGKLVGCQEFDVNIKV